MKIIYFDKACMCLKRNYMLKNNVIIVVQLLSLVQLLVTPWTAAYQAPPSMGFFQARVLEWGAIAFSREAPTYL